MSKGYTDLERARRGVDPAWTPRKLDTQLTRLEARIDSRHRLPVLGMVGVGLATACVAALTLWSNTSLPPTSVATRLPAERASATTQASTAPDKDRGQIADQEEENAKAQVTGTVASSEDSQAAENAPAAGSDAGVRGRSTRVKVAGTAWRSLAKEGRFKEAYRAMRGSEPDRMKAQVDELLLAGDAARLSGHAREAVPYYQAALEKAGRDPRAHLAAFTLGRTLLNELHEPRAAAEAFARAYRAAPRGPLAEEALARETESWTRAGDTARAQQAADRYRASYPQGQLLKR